jgi:hypothetical protein
MKSWCTLLVEFAKPAHKDITFLLPDASSEGIENALDAIAKDYQWTYKESKQKDGLKVLSYQTTYFGQIMTLGNQIIECTCKPSDNGMQITIESRLLAVQNNTALVMYFVTVGRYGLFDYFGKNQENIDKITSSLKVIFPTIRIIKPLRNVNNADEKITISLVTLAIIKIIYILIVVGVIVLVLSTLLTWIIQAYQHNGIAYF